MAKQQTEKNGKNIRFLRDQLHIKKTFTVNFCLAWPVTLILLTRNGIYYYFPVGGSVSFLF